MNYFCRSITWKCPYGHGQFTEYDQKKIYNIIKTNMVYCFQCDKFIKGINKK